MTANLASDHPQAVVRIAILDDDTVDRLHIRRLLASDAGLVVIAEGESAADAARVAADIDLLILDHHLPDGDGLSVLTWLRTQGDIPVLALTGSRDDELAAALIKAGADDYLAKDALSAERLCRTIRSTLLARSDRQRAERADHALRDLAAVAEAHDRDCLPALVAAVGKAWDADGCICLITAEPLARTDSGEHLRTLVPAATWGAVDALRMLTCPAHDGPQRSGDITLMALRDEAGLRRGLIAVQAVGDPHPHAIAVLRVAAARAVAALERAEQREHLEHAWRLERAVAATAGALLAHGGRRNPDVALRHLRDGLDADRAVLLHADADGMQVIQQQLGDGHRPSTWSTLRWRPRLVAWQAELNDGAIVARSLAALHGDEAKALADDGIGSIALAPILAGVNLIAVLRLDATKPNHWTRDRLRAVRHASLLIQAWWRQDPQRSPVQS